MELAVAEQINAYRIAAGLEKLRMDSGICVVAELRAREASVSWSHTRPDGGDWSDALAEYGHVGAVGENLIAVTGLPIAEALVAKWMTSETNASNILCDATAVGIGLYESNGYIYLAAIFVRQ